MQKQPNADILDVYLRDAGKAPLLKPNQVTMLAKKIQRGVNASKKLAKAKKQRTLTLITPGQKKKLVEAKNIGQEAEHELAEANLRLVVYIAKKYSESANLDLLDLTQEGNAILLRVVRQFKWRRGYQFSTYVTSSLERGIRDVVRQQSRTIRIPKNMSVKISRYLAINTRLSAELGREPSLEEIALHMELSPEQVDGLQKTVANTFSCIFSLEDILEKNTEVSLEDYLEDKRDPFFSKMRESLFTKEVLQGALRRRLTPQEQQVISLRFDLDGVGNILTLERVGERLDLTRQRVLQIQERALEKLREDNRVSELE